MLQECYKVALDKKMFMVAGKILQPFTLFHWRALECFGIDFAEEFELSQEELGIFIALCLLQNRAQICEFVEGNFSKELQKLSAEVMKNTHAETAQEIVEYLAYYRQAPSRTSNDDTQQTAPVWGMAKNYLVENCGYSNDEAWDCIVAEAFCEIAFHSSRRGDKTLDTEITINLKKMAADGMKQPSQEELQRMAAGL